MKTKIPDYIVQINISTLTVRVPAESAEAAMNMAETEIKKQLEKAGIKNVSVDSFCNSVAVDPKKTYIEAINLVDHPDICSVAEYFEDAGVIHVKDDESYCDKFFEWLSKQHHFKLFGCDITLVRVEKLWTALIQFDNPHTLPFPPDQLESIIVHHLAAVKKFPNSSPNPAKGSVPVPAGYADEASKKDITPDIEVV